MSNTQIEYIRRASDLALAVPNQIQLRPYTLTLVKSSWTGARPGLGTKTDGYTSLQNLASVSVRLRQVTKQDIILSGSLLQSQDLKIGPFVFPYVTDIGSGGTDPLLFSQPDTPTSQHYIKITGPNLPTNGNFYSKIGDDSNDKNVCYYLYLRNTGTKQP